MSELDPPFPECAELGNGVPDPLAVDDGISQSSDARYTRALALDVTLMACGVVAGAGFGEMEV